MALEEVVQRLGEPSNPSAEPLAAFLEKLLQFFL